MNPIAKELIESKLFAGVPPDFIENTILSLAREHDYPPDTYVLHPDNTSDRFHLITKGKLTLMNIFSDGSFSLIHILHPGSFLGLHPHRSKCHRLPLYGITSNEVHTISLPLQFLREMDILEGIDESIRLKITENLLRLSIHENELMETRLAIMSQKGLRNRILRFLQNFTSCSCSRTIELPMSREEMALYLCVNRSALSSELSQMAKEGIISYKKNTFTIHNHPERDDSLWDYL